MSRRASAALVVLAMLPMVSCSHGGAGHDDLVLTVRGAAEITSPAPVVRLASGRHKLKIGQTVRKITIARFSRTMSTLVAWACSGKSSVNPTPVRER